MPWRTASIMDERAEFVFEATKGFLPFAELCRKYGISRPTGYKWVRRGLTGLTDRSHRPRSCPHKIPAQVEKRILELRQHRRWGAPKLQRLLENELGWAPAIATIHRILDRGGLIRHGKARRRRERAPKAPFQADRPNALWTADFKGQFRTRDGQLCYPLTVQDAYSRFLLDCRALASPDLEATIHCFRRIFRVYGLPDRIRTDNGQPFASAVSLGRLSRLSAWWIRLGIAPELIEPGKPQQNGRHERMHRTLKHEAAQPPRATLEAQQRAFNEFRHTFNEDRPHQALTQRTPASAYHPSTRPLPTRPTPVQYPDHFEVRWVSQLGNIKWKSRFIFLSGIIPYEPVGLEEVGPGLWSVYYGPRHLGWLDENDNRIMDVTGARRRR